MSKRVTVIVEGREYIVEVGDLRESPIKAVVNQRTYHVEVPEQSTPSSGQAAPATSSEVSKRTDSDTPATTRSAITAPIPGNIVEVKVKVGDRVNPGDVVCVLEAMKMNNMIHTNLGGVIASVDVSAGQVVDYGTVLVTLE
ncbi:MAG: biotin/lipoyl-binding protein [Chloroflexota bacterium]|jgi:biotin carboxyl carrier protein